jgi:hypothetical protein
MNETEFTMVVNGVEYKAVWFDKEDDRKAEWYINRNGEKIGKYAGYPADRKHVENFIEFFLASR